MSEKTRCIRCQRAIDAVARICPYCNWDQSVAASEAATDAEFQDASAYAPPKERDWRRVIFMALGGVALLVGAFMIGSLVHGSDPPKNVPESVINKANAPAPRPVQKSAVTLVPVNDTSSIDAPITSAPSLNLAEGVPNEYQRSDATAVSSVEYAQLAARAKDEKKKMKEAVDPRTLSGPAYAQSSRTTASRPLETPSTDLTASTPSSERTTQPSSDDRSSNRPVVPTERARVIVSTRPVPEYQPIPDLHVSENVTARLRLTIGSDGRVKEVNVIDAIPGQTAKVIAAVQTWRFKPATENGVPVSAPFNVDLSFRANE